MEERNISGQPGEQKPEEKDLKEQENTEENTEGNAEMNDRNKLLFEKTGHFQEGKYDLQKEDKKLRGTLKYMDYFRMTPLEAVLCMLVAAAIVVLMMMTSRVEMGNVPFVLYIAIWGAFTFICMLALTFYRCWKEK